MHRWIIQFRHVERKRWCYNNWSAFCSRRDRIRYQNATQDLDPFWKFNWIDGDQPHSAVLVENDQQMKWAHHEILIRSFVKSTLWFVLLILSFIFSLSLVVSVGWIVDVSPLKLGSSFVFPRYAAPSKTYYSDVYLFWCEVNLKHLNRHLHTLYMHISWLEWSFKESYQRTILWTVLKWTSIGPKSVYILSEFFFRSINLFSLKAWMRNDDSFFFLLSLK